MGVNKGKEIELAVKVVTLAEQICELIGDNVKVAYSYDGYHSRHEYFVHDLDKHKYSCTMFPAEGFGRYTPGEIAIILLSNFHLVRESWR